jgi:hypothetical protein
VKRTWIAALVLALVACAPPLGADLPVAGGVTTEVIDIGVGTTYRVDVAPALDRLVLLFVGEDLAANASECVVTPTEISCVVRPVPNFYEVTIGGTVTFAQGVAQRGRDYSVVLFQASP